MSKKGKIEQLIARLNKRHKSETRIVLLNEGELVQNPDPEILYVRIVPASSVSSEDFD